MALEHVTVEVLLDAVMVEGSVGQVDAVKTHLAAEGLRDRLSLRIHHLRAALPVVDGKGAVIVLADHIDGACDVQPRVVDGPLLTVGTYLVVTDKAQEVLLLHLEAYLLRLTLIAEGTHGEEGAVAKIVLRLLVHERAHLGSPGANALPLLQRLLDGHTVALPLPLGDSLGIERLEEVGYQRTDRQQSLVTLIGIDMPLGFKVDILVLLVLTSILEGQHFRLHLFRSYHYYPILPAKILKIFVLLLFCLNYFLFLCSSV